MSGLTITPVTGMPEVRAGDDLAEMVCARADLLDGDVVVIAQKVVSKAEGMLVSGTERADVIASETARVLARREDLLIVRTHHGFVCANAGVDTSNVEQGSLSLLPRDPDASAAALRDAIRARSGATVGVIVADTFGRPWRIGQTNVALGVAGITPVRDHRGETDTFGNELQATVIAVADEIAGAAELVMRKADGVPVAIVRGLDASGEGSGRDLLRPIEDDLFPAGGVEVLGLRRSVRRFADRAVPEQVVARAVRAAGTAPAPHGSRTDRPWLFVWLRSDAARDGFLEVLGERWRGDLLADDTPEEVIERRRARSDELLGTAPVLLACFVSIAQMDRYDESMRARGAERARAEREMFIAAGGAAVQNLMVALAAQGVGSCWVSSSIFAPDEASAALGLGAGWAALGCVAAGYPAEAPPPRGEPDAGRFMTIV